VKGRGGVKRLGQQQYGRDWIEVGGTLGNRATHRRWIGDQTGEDRRNRVGSQNDQKGHGEETEKQTRAGFVGMTKNKPTSNKVSTHPAGRKTSKKKKNQGLKFPLGKPKEKGGEMSHHSYT